MNSYATLLAPSIGLVASSADATHRVALPPVVFGNDENGVQTIEPRPENSRPDDARRSVDTTGPSAESLIISVGKEKDRDAFRVLHSRFSPKILGFVRRLGTDQELAEEIVQETFVNLWRKAHLFDPEKASASTWLYAIARNARVDHLRKSIRPALDPDDPALVPDPEASAFSHVSRVEEAALLRAAMADLPGEQQEVLRLSFLDERSHASVAEELGIPLGTVKSRIRLAIGHMRSVLGEMK